MNRLPGHIAAVDMQGSIALIDAVVGKQTLTAMLIEASHDTAQWQVGTPVTLLFKETEVALARHLSGMISMRNRMPCTVTGMECGKLLTRVQLNFDGHAIESVITTRSAMALGIAVGIELEALVKANEMAVISA
jgi:molybdate transport system regulatory protein